MWDVWWAFLDGALSPMLRREPLDRQGYRIFFVLWLAIGTTLGAFLGGFLTTYFFPPPYQPKAHLHWGALLLGILLALLYAYGTIAYLFATARRFLSLGKSPLYALLLFVPLINFYVLFLALTKEEIIREAVDS
jgi:MFS family permease